VKAVIHLHSSSSFDSITDPKAIVDKAVTHQINILCITDHDTIEGSVKASEYAKTHYKEAIKIIIGAEFSTDWGDIIGINIKENIDSKDAKHVIENIKKQGGLVLLPHPFDSHKNIEYLAKEADLIEVFNARSKPINNQKALELATKLDKPIYVASDAHFLSDTMLCVNNLPANSNFYEALLSPNKSFETAYSSQLNYLNSQLIKGIKKKKIKLILRIIGSIVAFYFRKTSKSKQ
jgi:predicted metal-dependent phosphoesterase TrpH